MSSTTQDLCFTEFLNYMTNGDPGAREVIGIMLNTDPPRTAKALNKLDDKDIRGSELWDMYTECKMNVQAFFKRVEAL